jgi:plasmid stability protein
MAKLIARNIDEETVRRLKLQAAQHSRSAEAEHRAILQQILGTEQSAFWEKAEKFRAATRDRKPTDSTTLIRQERDRRSSRSK